MIVIIVFCTLMNIIICLYNFKSVIKNNLMKYYINNISYFMTNIIAR